MEDVFRAVWEDGQATQLANRCSFDTPADFVLSDTDISDITTDVPWSWVRAASFAEALPRPRAIAPTEPTCAVLEAAATVLPETVRKTGDGRTVAVINDGNSLGVGTPKWSHYEESTSSAKRCFVATESGERRYIFTRGTHPSEVPVEHGDYLIATKAYVDVVTALLDTGITSDVVRLQDDRVIVSPVGVDVVGVVVQRTYSGSEDTLGDKFEIVGEL